MQAGGLHAGAAHAGRSIVSLDQGGNYLPGERSSPVAGGRRQTPSAGGGGLSKGVDARPREVAPEAIATRAASAADGPGPLGGTVPLGTKFQG